MGGLLHLVQRGGDWAGPQPVYQSPYCCMVVVRCSGFNVTIKGLKQSVAARNSLPADVQSIE